MTRSDEAVRRHSRAQRRYFESSDRPRMLPRDSRYLRRHVDSLVRFLQIEREERVLEIGCGMGRYTLLLADRGLRIEGLDLSPVLLRRLRDFDAGRHDIPLHCADVLDVPPALEGSFDVVVGLFTLHHLHDLTRSFEAVSRLLRPGGRVGFLEPNAYNPLFYLQILLTPGMTWRGDGGVVRMRPSVVFGALREAGFTRPALQRFGFFPPFLADRPWGSRVETVLERFEPWRGILPFQLFRAELP